MGHFKKTNAWLQERYGEEGGIDWDLNKPKPIAGPPVATPVKVTETQKKPVEADGPVTESLHTSGKTAEDEFGEMDDEDALEALEAVENSSAAGEV